MEQAGESVKSVISAAIMLSPNICLSIFRAGMQSPRVFAFLSLSHTPCGDG